MSEHTPGPWNILKTYEDGTTRHCPVVVSGKGWIAETAGMHGQQDANARLIAAAPQLLEALKGLVNLRDSTERIYEDSYNAMFKDEGEDQWSAAESAIKAAEEGE